MPTWDPITWNPRRGSTGDDQYEPFAIGFNPDDAPIIVGSTGSGTVGTFALVNNCSYFNQIVSEIDRRRRKNALINFTWPSSLVTGANISAATIVNLQNAINALRQAENPPNFTADDYAFTSWSDDSLVISTALFELRKALGLRRYTVYFNDDRTAGGMIPLYRLDNPLGTLQTDWQYQYLLGTNQGEFCATGKLSTTGPTRTVRARITIPESPVSENEFIIRTAMPTIVTGTLGLRLSAVIVTLEAFGGNMEVYMVSPRASVSAPTMAAQLSNLIAQPSVASLSLPAVIAMSLDVSVLNAYTKDTEFAVMLANSAERAATGASVSGFNQGSYARNAGTNAFSSYTSLGIGGYLKLEFN